MRSTRNWTLVLLLFVAADLLDPFGPGVFSFESPNLFVDAAVQLTQDPALVAAPAVPTPVRQWVGAADSPRLTSEVRLANRQLVWRTLRPHMKRDYPAVFAPSAPEDH